MFFTVNGKTLKHFSSVISVSICLFIHFWSFPKFLWPHLRKKQYILQEGDVSRYENFIVKGVTRTYEVDDKGQEHVVQFGMEDWWVGDLYSFLSETPSTYNIDCLEDVRTCA